MQDGKCVCACAKFGTGKMFLQPSAEEGKFLCVLPLNLSLKTCTQEQDSVTQPSLKASLGQIYASYTKWKVKASVAYYCENELL